jgi:ABC-2 type transport system ATP-binding protein
VRHDLFDVLATLRDKTGVTILLTTHYLDEAERLCDRIAIVDVGRIIACDTPANFLGILGDEVLEIRAEDTSTTTQTLRAGGIPEEDILVIGSTVTASLRGASSENLLLQLRHAGVNVRAATTRTPTLDDVYLRLTGGHITAAEE